MPGGGADAGGHLVLGAREKHRHEAAHHQVIDFLLSLAQPAWRLERWDDRKVVAHLGVVKYPLGRFDVIAVQRSQRMGRQVPHAGVSQHLKGLLDHGHVVLWQRPRVGTRVGQRLVALVQALRDRQRGLGRVTELAIGLALKAGQVKQWRCSLGGGLAFFCDAGALAAHRIGNGLRLTLAPDPVGFLLGVLSVLFVFGIEPFGGVLAGLCGKAGVNFPVVAADELADLLFPLDHHRQRGRLHPPDGRQEKPAVTRVERGHGTRAVDADQPVGLAAAARGIGQRLHLRIAAQGAKAISDRLWRHALQPQAAHGLAQRFGAAGVLFDQPEDQFALAASVAGVDDLVDILALGQPNYGVQACLGLVHWLEVKVRRNHRQVGKAPFAALDIECLGRLDLDQVADRAGDHIAFVLEVLVVLFELARQGRECAHDVLGHRGFFGND